MYTRGFHRSRSVDADLDVKDNSTDSIDFFGRVNVASFLTVK